MKSINTILKYIVIASKIKLLILNNSVLMKNIILWLFLVFIFIGMINGSYAQVNLNEYLNSNHLYTRNNDGSISDTNIVRNENYLRQYILEYNFDYKNKKYPPLQVQVPFNDWFNQLLSNELPSITSDSRHESYYRLDKNYKELIDSIEAFSNDGKNWNIYKIRKHINQLRKLDDIEKKTEAFIFLLGEYENKSSNIEKYSYDHKDISNEVDSLITQSLLESIGEIDIYCQNLKELIDNKTWFQLSYQQIPADGYKTAEESDSKSMKYIRCLKKYGDFFLKRKQGGEALALYYQAYFIAFFHKQILELGNIELKIGYVYKAEGISKYSKLAVDHIVVADTIFDYCNHSKGYLYQCQIARIKALNLYLSDKSFLENYMVDELVEMLKTTIQEELSNQEKYYLYSAIGIYFGKTGYPNDLNIAKMYLQTSLFYCMNDFKNYDFDQLDFILSWISWINSVIGDKENCHKYNDWALTLAEKHQRYDYKCYDWFLRANFARGLKEHDEAVTYLKIGLELAQKKNIPEYFWAKYGYSVAISCYKDLKLFYKNDMYQDTIDYYNKLYNESVSKDDLQNWMQYDYEMQRKYTDLNNQLDLSNKQKEYNYKIGELEAGINYKQFISDQLELNYIKKNKLYDILKSQFSGLKAKLSIDSLKRSQLLNENNDLKIANDEIQLQVGSANQQKVNAENAKFWAIAVGIGAICLSIFIMWVIYRGKKKKYDKHISKKNAEIQQSNTRAAISQLYARTDSHDLGHVLDAYKSKTEFYFDEENGQYIFVENSNLKDELLKKYTHKNFDGKELSIYPNLMGYFNQYLKTRMDFRADVATTDPNSLTTLDFYQDIFVPFNNNLIFNNRISGIADKDLKYKFKILKGDSEITNDDKLPVAIPNDILGCQAMYIIWSNVIRNTVKHGELKDNEKKLILSIRINEYTPSQDFYEISFFTNVFRGKSYIDDLVTKRNKSFDAKIWNENEVDHKGRLRDNSLGTIEMATCAAYLRKMAVTEVDDTNFDLFSNAGEYLEGKPFEENGSVFPMIMYAYAQPELIDNGTETQYSLGYKFYLLKPKEILVVCDRPDILSNSLINYLDKGVLSKHGIEFIKSDVLNNKTYNHKFLAFVGEQSDYNKFKIDQILTTGSLPKRQVLIKPGKTFEYIADFNKECWNYWLDQYHKSVNIFKCFENEITLVYPDKKDDNANLTVHLFSHHLGLNKPTTEEIIKTLEDGNYNEMICGHHWTKKNLLEDLTIDDFKFSKFAEPYIECVFTNVIVMDERIQKSIVIHKKKYAEKIPFANYFDQLGIFIPSKLKEGDPDLNNTNLMDEKKKITNYIERYIDNSSFVIIHLGILEKLLSDKNDKSETAIDAILNEIISGKVNRRKVIITSGRGKANNVKSDISYVPISLVQNAIETTFDKYRLIQILYNSRKSL